MLRECHIYHEELKSCESFKGRFNQFYIGGRTADCAQWREDHEDCKVGGSRQTQLEITFHLFQ